LPDLCGAGLTGQELPVRRLCTQSGFLAKIGRNDKPADDPLLTGRTILARLAESAKTGAFQGEKQ